MLFNSLDFAVFLPLVFFLYWFAANKSLKIQNFFLVLASYVFYGWWDYRFLILIFVSTLVDYFAGLAISRARAIYKRRIYLGISIFINLGLLGFFKYYNFFIINFTRAFSFFGCAIQARTLNIILPVGISFYTFQTLSYTIDIYRNRLKPTKDFIAFSAFVSFFPQLVAGPIERAVRFLPCFYEKRVFDYNRAVNGLRLILWGLFKKVVIADNCARYVDLAFNNARDYNGSTLFLGVFFFAFQIYGDFSGYSDIASGTAGLFGFDLTVNFRYPYFSGNMAQFWRRWHISLSSWFKDYVYIPLGGSRGGWLSRIRNIFIVFILSGLWHGAQWKFIIWGLLNALFVLPALLSSGHKQRQGEGGGMLFTFCLTLLPGFFLGLKIQSRPFLLFHLFFPPPFF
jgi:D-alanyl-lipoteichoic acid acyltransferase DltB (MBOAT superfamily)